MFNLRLNFELEGIGLRGVRNKTAGGYARRVPTLALMMLQLQL
jgi:hypothetical protein